MSRYRVQVEVPAQQQWREQVVCDVCSADRGGPKFYELRNPWMGCGQWADDELDTTVKLECAGDAGMVTMQEFDVCPRCFAEVLAPVLESLRVSRRA